MDLHGAAPFATVTFETDGDRAVPIGRQLRHRVGPRSLAKTRAARVIPALVSKQAPPRDGARRVSSRLLD